METSLPAGQRADAADCQWLSQMDKTRYQQVAQRVVGQLLQTLLYEEVLTYRRTPLDEGQTQFVIQGRDAQGAPVEYRCTGLFSDSFDLIRLDYASLRRRDRDGVIARPSLHQLLSELLSESEDPACLARFVQELEQTQLKDLQSRAQSYPPVAHPHRLDFDALERHFMDAHSYHPCYKSRIGFTLDDNAQWGPEFAAPISLVWLAVEKRLASVNHSSRLDLTRFLDEEVGEVCRREWAERLEQQGKRLEDYWLIPAHPWQWRNVILPACHTELASGEMIWLGTTADRWQAQQSIRTLANRSVKTRPYVKLALSITNTSSTRILARHTVMNGPIITDWLQQLMETDRAAQDMKCVILGEIAGVSLDTRQHSASRSAQTYGVLGALWRESIHAYLQPGEQAIPFNGLSHVENRYGEGETVPFIDAWIRQYGLENWTRQLLSVTVSPIIHMLFAEGIGMESHGQNIVLIARDGWPQRIALKDFHDGVRYSPQHLARPDRCPVLAPLPPGHAKINRNSFILTDDVNAVRDFTCDAFFFICLAEMAIFLRQHYGMDESRFWRMTADVILDYQAAHPQHRVRYALFDVFAPTYEVEALTQRRLFGDGERRFKAVPNPLYPFRPSSC